MNREQIIQMARDAGFHFMDAGYGPETLHTTPNQYSEKCFERFAQIIIAATKEEDAKICEAEHLEDPQDGNDDAYDAAVDHCALAIRASK